MTTGTIALDLIGFILEILERVAYSYMNQSYQSKGTIQIMLQNIKW